MNTSVLMLTACSEVAASDELGALNIPSSRLRRWKIYGALIIFDWLAIFFGFSLPNYIFPEIYLRISPVDISAMVSFNYVIISLYADLYSIRSLQNIGTAIAKAVSGIMIAFLTVLLLLFYTKSTVDLSRAGISLGVLFSASLLVAVRILVRRMVRWRWGDRVTTVLVINDGGPPVALPEAIQIDAQRYGLAPILDDPDALHRIGTVLRNADCVIVSAQRERDAAWTTVLKSANVTGEVVNKTVARLHAIGARNAGGQGLLRVSAGPLGVRARMAKRAFDIVVAAVALTLLIPILILVAIAIKCEDGGPVFFLQRRVGRANRFFTIYKFRSMTYSRAGLEGSQSAMRHDPRVTRVGRFIRSTSIDELPQLFNVLTGSMSLVGPRPHAIGSQAGGKLFWEVDARYWLRHSLKPGLTGLAQVRGWRGATDNEADLSARLACDLEYVAGWSLQRDIRIIFQTMRVIIHDRAF